MAKHSFYHLYFAFHVGLKFSFTTVVIFFSLYNMELICDSVYSTNKHGVLNLFASERAILTIELYEEDLILKKENRAEIISISQ